MARERARAGASDERTPGPTAILPKGRRRNGRNTPPAGKLTAWTAARPKPPHGETCCA